MIGAECESNGLYWLSYPPHVCSLVIDLFTLHAQLGYPSLAKLQKMVPNLSKLSSLPCESSQLGKNTCSPFPDRVSSHSASRFALVRYDIWGPSCTVSTLGSGYFITFIDDYSRCTCYF